MKEWLSQHIVNIVIPISCVFLTWWITMRHERKKAHSQEIRELQNEVSTLKSKLDLYEAIERFADSDCYVMKATGDLICPTCWGAEQKPIPARDDGTGHYTCPHCHGKGVYSHKGVKAHREEMHKQIAAIGTITHGRNSRSHW